ncbi:MAG: hypothetical protein JRJ19_00575, partial [Deltaproteobacteria bacterium]|nr:hypothetical protein [Deltaproteobacteria bacterium]
MLRREVWFLLVSCCLSLALIGFAGCSDGERKVCEHDTDCDLNSHCEAGGCVPNCPGTPCLVGQLCCDGRCYEKDCEARTCPGVDEVCLDGRCVGASCIDAICDPGMRCAGGDCYPEDC